MTQHILIVGNDLLAPKLMQSTRVGKISVAPGNSKTANNVPIAETDADGLLQWATEHKPDLTVISSAAALAAGVVDAFQAAGLRVFGPTKTAAQIGSSGVFAKQFMQRHAIPTMPFEVFDTFRRAIGYLLTEGDQKLTIRADGAGVHMTDCVHDAETVVRDLMVNQSVARIVIEPQFEGREARIAAFSDGTHVHALKAESANPLLQATIDALQTEGSPFVGVLGARWTPDEPRILAYYIGLDDPALTRLKTDLLDIFDACLNGTLAQINLE